MEYKIACVNVDSIWIDAVVTMDSTALWIVETS